MSPRAAKASPPPPASKKAKPAARTSTQQGAPSRLLAQLREICLAMPGATEEESHGEPTWFAGPKGKVFAMLDDHHHGAPHVSVWLATPRELRDALIASEPSRYFVPPYVGPKGWVGVVLDRDPHWGAVERLVREAFDAVRPRTARRQPR